MTDRHTDQWKTLPRVGLYWTAAHQSRNIFWVCNWLPLCVNFFTLSPVWIWPADCGAGKLRPCEAESCLLAHVKLPPTGPISSRLAWQRDFAKKKGLADICKHQYIISGYWLIRDIGQFPILLINGIAMDLSSAVPCSERRRILRIWELGQIGRTSFAGKGWQL